MGYVHLWLFPKNFATKQKNFIPKTINLIPFLYNSYYQQKLKCLGILPEFLAEIKAASGKEGQKQKLRDLLIATKSILSKQVEA